MSKGKHSEAQIMPRCSRWGESKHRRCGSGVRCVQAHDLDLVVTDRASAEEAARWLSKVRNDYHFITPWHVPGTIDRVYDLIANSVDYPRWWALVYLEAEELACGDEKGLGRRFRFLTKGFLPYTLR